MHDAQAGPGSDALELEGVGKRYGHVQVLDDVTLRVAAGEFHALIGPNGAGKSSLFNVISGLTPPSAGRVRLHGRDVTGLAAHRMARSGLSRSFQVANVFGRMSVFDNLRCAAMRTGGWATNGGARWIADAGWRNRRARSWRSSAWSRARIGRRAN